MDKPAALKISTSADLLVTQATMTAAEAVLVSVLALAQLV